MIHFLPKALVQDREPISVCLIGVGGTGSQLLPQLARIHTTLQALGKQGLQITVYDGDTVSEANLARQLFTTGDVGANKAVLQVSRLNRFYGISWQA
ncbi:MAG: ThiF family adenylyltransferase, partial [Tunicatimonas sp.]|uniref:ThiF family adenylyltransferase n=1 Tax=Tunicatimonas sp. TaxID=1940096 RepID=UPI003C745909